MENNYIFKSKFNKLSYSEILDIIHNKNEIYVKNDKEILRYNIISCKKGLEMYLENLDYDDKDGVIFNTEIDFEASREIVHKLEKFENCVFLNSLKIIIDAAELESEIFQIENCIFFKKFYISFYNNFELDIRNSIFNELDINRIPVETGVLTISCTKSEFTELNLDYLQDLLLNRSKVDVFRYSFISPNEAFFAPRNEHRCKNIIINESEVNNLLFSNFLCEKISINYSRIKFLDFDGLIINQEFMLNQISLQHSDSFCKIQNTSCFGRSQINFNEIAGKIRLYKVYFQQCFLDYEQFEANDYKQLVSSEDTKYTKWSYFNFSTIFMQNGKHDQYLTTFRKYKIWENKEKVEKMRERGKLQNVLSYFYALSSNIVNVTCGYFTKPFNTVISILLLIISFSIIYLFPSFKCEDKVTTLSFFESLYFSIISFATIGYGDISPLGLTRFIAGVEGLLGIILISVLTITFARKYVL